MKKKVMLIDRIGSVKRILQTLKEVRHPHRHQIHHPSIHVAHNPTNESAQVVVMVCVLGAGIAQAMEAVQVIQPNVYDGIIDDTEI